MVSAGSLFLEPEEFPSYLAVQDGMTAADVIPHLARYYGLFVDGSLAWKLATGAAWVRLAHRRRLRCYVGRVGTAACVRRAREIGTDSVDLRYAEMRIAPSPTD